MVILVLQNDVAIFIFIDCFLIVEKWFEMVWCAAWQLGSCKLNITLKEIVVDQVCLH